MNVFESAKELNRKTGARLTLATALVAAALSASSLSGPRAAAGSDPEFEGRIYPEVPQTLDDFGNALDLDGERIVVGA